MIKYGLFRGNDPIPFWVFDHKLIALGWQINLEALGIIMEIKPIFDGE